MLIYVKVCEFCFSFHLTTVRGVTQNLIGVRLHFIGFRYPTFLLDSISTGIFRHLYQDNGMLQGIIYDYKHIFTRHDLKRTEGRIFNGWSLSIFISLLLTIIFGLLILLGALILGFSGKEFSWSLHILCRLDKKIECSQKTDCRFSFQQQSCTIT